MAFPSRHHHDGYPRRALLQIPQDSPIAVRGARNYPCMEHPGKRAPTVEICNSDKPFEPLAMRQHIFGTYPLDPNLLAQGIPPDDRVGFYRDRIFGPVEGTPRPPGPLPPAGPLSPPGAPAGAPNPAPPPPAPAPQAVPPGLRPIAPIDVPDVPSPRAAPGSGGTHAAPSSFGRNDSGAGPSLAVVHYDPLTGGYVGPDRQLYRQSDLVTRRRPKPGRTCFPPSLRMLMASTLLAYPQVVPRTSASFRVTNSDICAAQTDI
jgi:phospholipid/cholesterol/gamma-HCH transport system substrate-binding protein